MTEAKVNVLSVSLEGEARAPRRAHPSDVGLDVWVTAVTRRGEGLYFCETGLILAPPEGFYVEVIPRSSVVWRGFILANSVGVIDPSYRGTLKLPLRYLGSGDPDQEAASLVGERVAQLVLRALVPCELRVCAREELPAPLDSRDAGGFGSTGQR